MKNLSRRNFLHAAPVAAAAGFTLANASLFSAHAEGQSATPGAIQLFSAQNIQDDINALKAAPANNTILDRKTFTIILTVETAKTAKEFEWHEGRDHVVQILEGSTVLEVGGTPKDGRNVKPGEWLAPASEGATTYALKKGDMLIIPRNTPHKRITAESVTLMLISPMGTASS